MTLQQHHLATKLALRTSSDLKTLFDRMGHSDAPRGRILRAYRNARRALEGNIDNRFAVDEALLELRASAMGAMAELLTEAQALGQRHAESSLVIYEMPVIVPATLPEQLAAAGEAWTARLDAQLASARGLALSGQADSLIIGDESRAGVLTPGPIVNEGARWLAQLTQGAWIAVVGESARPSGAEFWKQVIAALDRRTTDCCIRVHGQAVPLDKPFKLTGEPRYADEVMDPPFHWWCRTAEALVLASDVDDALSREMRSEARLVLSARESAQRAGGN